MIQLFILQLYTFLVSMDKRIDQKCFAICRKKCLRRHKKVKFPKPKSFG